MVHGGLGVIVLGVAFAACGHTASREASSYVLRVDQTLDRSNGRRPADPLDDASYQRVAPHDAYTITVENDRVTVVGLEGSKSTFGGRREDSPAGESRFVLETGVFAGGRLVLRGTRAELTVFGSGVPIVASDSGDLVRR